MKRGPRTKQGYVKLTPGDAPKPQRIKALAKHVGRLSKEIMGAEEMAAVIAAKDPRTRASYYEALALLKLASLDLEEATQKLNDALQGQERKCAYCPKMFVPRRTSKIFCSTKCRANSSYHSRKNAALGQRYQE